MYTGNSPLKGEGKASARSIDQWMQSNGKRVMERNGVTGWKIPDVGEYIVKYGQMTGLNSDLAAAQIAKESAFLTSLIYRDKLNPSGLGAVNDSAYESAITFETVEEGIRASYAHLSSYVYGEDHVLIEWSVRHQILRDVGYLGVVQVLQDLNQRWAWSPPEDYAATPDHLRYGQSTATWANRLLEVHDGMDEDPVTEIELPYHKDIGKKFREDGPFAEYWRFLVSRLGFEETLMIIGYPITDEFELDGVTMQYTERTRLEYHPGKYPQHFDVLLGHLGREDVMLKGEKKERGTRIDKIKEILKKLR